jgi:hypothetical protein
LVERVARTTAIACLVIALIVAVWRGALAGLAVLGGGALIGLSFWAIRGTVDTLVRVGAATTSRAGESGPNGSKPGGISTAVTLVKFFTRHGIVALAAYGMMVRLHLDPLGLLAGVSSLGVAVGVEALRDLRWRRFL